MTVQAAGQGTAVTITTTTETVAAVIPQLEEVLAGGGGVLIHGYVNVTVGTTAVSLQVKVRQGTTNAGTQVGVTDTVNGLTAGNSYSVPFAQVFNGALPYGNQFCVTVTQPAATANGTINDACIWMDSLSVGG
jgi:hypothetical protein